MIDREEPVELPAEVVLTTPRLQLVRVTAADAPFVLDLLNSPGWLRFIGDRGVRTLGDARAYIRDNYQASYRRHGYGGYRVRRVADGVSVGMCGLFKRDTLDHPDIGFAFLTGFKGQGYGYEAASALLTYARQTLGLPRLLAIVNPDNAPSIGLIEKLGLRYEGPYLTSGRVIRQYGRSLAGEPAQ